MLAPAVVKGLQVAGPAFFLSMQGSAVKTALSIWANQSVGPLSPFPFVSLLTNCVIWSYYGFLRQDMTVLIPNAIGIASGLVSIACYHRFAPEKPTAMYAGAVAIIALATSWAMAGNFKLLGFMGCALAVILTASPLVTLATVVKDRSTAALPFLTSASAFCNSLSWSAYGLLVAHDSMIYGPNLLGLVLATIQMSLYVIFGLPPPVVKAKSIF